MAGEESKTPGRRAMAINGVCIVLGIVGLSLVSNRLLDMVSVAGERGLSIEERKEKAQRNNEEYRNGIGGSTWRLAGWFSRDTADKMCADSKIVVTATRLINESTPNLGQFGVAAARMDAARIGDTEGLKKFESLRAKENEIRIVSEALPTSYDQSIDRALCQVRYAVKGLGYSENVPMTATYTVQYGKSDWVVTLISLN